jgi:NADPH:quinone reductase-like Zn-dependent oxidoreductase
MKAVQINHYIPINEVEVNQNTQKPLTQPGQLLVEVKAASVNPIDWKICEGFVKQRFELPFPITLGKDFSGTVLAVGSGVSGYKAGDEVYGESMIFNHGSGSFAEFINVDPKGIAHKPKNLSHIEAAALPLAGISAWQALVDFLHLKQGQKVLIHGGAGGIGSLAIQLAKYLGAHVATTASTENIKYVQSLGADEVIDYKNQKFETILKDYDAVFDTIGGETYAKSYQVLKKGGAIVSMLEAPREELMKQFGVKAFYEFTDINSESLKKLTEMVDQNRLNIQIDKTFPLDEARQALIHLRTGHPRGKVVIRMKNGESES